MQGGHQVREVEPNVWRPYWLPQGRRRVSGIVRGQHMSHRFVSLRDWRLHQWQLPLQSEYRLFRWQRRNTRYMPQEKTNQPRHITSNWFASGSPQRLEDQLLRLEDREGYASGGLLFRIYVPARWRGAGQNHCVSDLWKRLCDFWTQYQ